MRPKLRLFLLVILLGIPASPLVWGLELQVSKNNTIGAPVVVYIQAPEPIIDVAKVKLTFTKPDGKTTESTARQETWNPTNECFDIYTLDYVGTFTVDVVDGSTGAMASTTFDSAIFSRGSLIVYIISLVSFVGFILYFITNRKKLASTGIRAES